MTKESEPLESRLKQHLPGGNFGAIPPQRSKAMGAVKQKGNKTTERRLRAALARAGISGWIMHPPQVIGTPDFFFPHVRLAVFVDGCFWHGCSCCAHAFKTRSA